MLVLRAGYAELSHEEQDEIADEVAAPPSVTPPPACLPYPLRVGSGRCPLCTLQCVVEGEPGFWLGTGYVFRAPGAGCRSVRGVDINTCRVLCLKSPI